ncbi:MAG: hypothetical protein EON56_00140 [Alphaproteobacteria bacterium]|nr:MAG: hypothetical protein EON56_00140 [Alphaproteobacteria bacterium]
MPRYYFHVRDGVFLPDREGTKMPDDATARREAISAAGTMLSDIAGSFWDHGEWVMIVEESGREVCILTFSGKSPKPD